MHLFDQEWFSYMPGESVIVPSNIEMIIDFLVATIDNTNQCLALAIEKK